MATSKIAPMPPQSAFQQGYGIFQYRNTVGTGFDFSIRLPESFTAYPVVDKVPTREMPFTVLMTSHGADEDVQVIVWGVLMHREINPVDWLDGWLSSQGMRPLDMQLAKSSYGVLANVLATGTSKGKTLLHRLATVKDGNRLLLLEARSSQAKAARMQEVFAGALTGFKFDKPTHERFAEPFAYQALPGATPLQVALPASWQSSLSPNAPDGGAFFQAENMRGETSVGTILIVTSPAANDAPSLERVTLENLAANGIVLVPDSGAFGTVESTPLPSQIARLDARRGDLGLDMTLLRAGAANVSVSAILLSPERDRDFEAWAINRRAFEILVESLQRAQ